MTCVRRAWSGSLARRKAVRNPVGPRNSRVASAGDPRGVGTGSGSASFGGR